MAETLCQIGSRDIIKIGFQCCFQTSQVLHKDVCVYVLGAAFLCKELGAVGFLWKGWGVRFYSVVGNISEWEEIGLSVRCRTRKKKTPAKLLSANIPAEQNYTLMSNASSDVRWWRTFIMPVKRPTVYRGPSGARFGQCKLVCLHSSVYVFVSPCVSWLHREDGRTPSSNCW